MDIPWGRIVKFGVNRVMNPARVDEQYARCRRFYDLGINVSLRPMSVLDGTKLVDGYTGDMLHLMKLDLPGYSANQKNMPNEVGRRFRESYYLDLAERMNAYNFNYFKDWGCSAGYQSVVLIATRFDERLPATKNFLEQSIISLYSTKCNCVMLVNV